MFCSKCGNSNPDNALHCSACGEPLVSNPNPAPAYNPAPASEPGKGLAIASMVCGIVSFFFFGLVLSVVALVLGLVAKNKGYTGGMATAGVATGSVALGLSLLSMIACGSILVTM